MPVRHCRGCGRFLAYPEGKLLHKCGFKTEKRRGGLKKETGRYYSLSAYHIAACRIADLVVEKQAAYGDSFGKSGTIMRILYPDGIKPEQLDDALTIVRTVDKLFRIATKKNAFGESPWQDIMGYALLAKVKDNFIHKIAEITPGITGIERKSQ